MSTYDDLKAEYDEQRKNMRHLAEDEFCPECWTVSGADRRHVEEQAMRAWTRWKTITGTYEQCLTCGTFWGIHPFNGAYYIAPFEWDDYWAWRDHPYPRPELHASRSTRVPVKPARTSLADAEPTADGPTLEIRDVPHEWRTW